MPNAFAVRIERGGRPLRGAEVVVTFEMLDMEMGNQAYRLTETSPGLYTHAAPALVMVGHWGLSYSVTPPGEPPFDILLVDRANG